MGGFNDEANQFIDASVGLRDRQLRRARIVAGVGFTLAGLASLASMFAFIQQQKAQKQSIVSITKNVESLLLNNNQIDAMVEAIKAKKELDNLWMGKESVSLRVLSSLAGAVHHNQEGWNERLQTLRGHKDSVYGVAFSPNGKQIATGSQDGTLRLWKIGDIDDMLSISCDWVRHYLETKPENDEDRYLCDGVGE